MPQYLARDFVHQAVSNKQQLLGRMLLPCPEHLERVETYPHQGRLDDSLFLAPWKHTTAEQDGLLPSVCEECLFWPELHVSSAISASMKELAEFTSSVLLSELVFSEATDGGATISSPELIGSLRSHDQSHDTMSLEIELAMEAEEEGLAIRMQGLHPESLQSWTEEGEDTRLELSLEDMLDPALLDLGTLNLPSLATLTQRLQPKSVQDPFTDEMGRQRSHAVVLARDVQFEEVSLCNKGRLEHREVFLGEDLSFRSEEEEVVVVIAGSSRHALLSEPLTSSLVSTFDSLCLPKLDPFTDDDLEVEHELEGLCLAFPSPLRGGGGGGSEPMEVGERDAVKDKETSFALLNHNSVSLSDSVDSGCLHMYLESPSSGTSELGEGGHLMTSLIEEELALLEAIPTSPEVAVRKMRIIESSEERRLTEELRGKEVLFDDILACLLPVPKCPEQSMQIPSSSFSAAVLCLKQVDKDMEAEFSLRWDPLHDGHVAMEMVQAALRADFHFVVRGASVCPTRLSEKEALEFEQEALELQEVPEGYMSLFGVEGGGREAPASLHRLADSQVRQSRLQPRTSSGSEASLPQSINQSTTTSAKPSSLMLTMCPSEESQMHGAGRSSGPSGGVGIGGGTLTENMSPLDFFVMMRKGGSQGSSQSRKVTTSLGVSGPLLGGEDGRERGGGQRRAPEESCSEGKRQREDIVLTGVPLVAYEVVEHQGQLALNELQRGQLGLQLPARFGSVEVDTASFLLRQQETAAATAESNISPEQQDALLDSCRWAATLLVLVCVSDCLLNSSFDSALNQLFLLTDQYTQYIGDSLNHVRADLGKLQAQLKSSRRCLHPKAEWLVAKLASWSAPGEGGVRRKEKALVLIAGDFTTISAEGMNALNAVSGLSACVFALEPKHPGDVDYLQEVETRLQHYSCLLVPPSCIADCFPWERISLVIEYNTLTHGHTHTVKSHAHMEVCTLRGVVRKDVPVAAVGMWPHSASGGAQYKLICSQNVTSNFSLMQLLESRLNIVILERDYTCIAASSNGSKGEGLTRVLHYADVILDEHCGILLHPLDQLTSPEGFKMVTTRVTTLSLQYERLWILLYTSESGSYPYTGHVPVNIAKINASVANFSAEKDKFVAHVVVAGSVEDAACFIRRFGERAHLSTTTWSQEDWCKRNWLVDELSAHEKFLLHFPCLTAFSSQLMLATYSLKDLLTSNCPTLLHRLPWIPEKCVKMFHALSHLSTSPLPLTLPTHHTTTVAPLKAPHMLAPSTAQNQSGTPASALLLSTQQSTQQHLHTHPIQAAMASTQGMSSGVVSGHPHAGSVPCTDRLDVGGNCSTSSGIQKAFWIGNGDQRQHILEQTHLPPKPDVKQCKRKSFYRYTAPTASVETLQGSSAEPSTHLTLPHTGGVGLPPQQDQVVRSKFFSNGPSPSNLKVETKRGLKKLLAYGRQKEEEQSRVPSVRSSLEPAQVTGSKGARRDDGSVDQVLPVPVVPPAPTSDDDGTWPPPSALSRSRREAEFVTSIADIWGHHQELHASGKSAAGGGAYQEVGVVRSLQGTTPSGRKRQPIKCFSLGNEDKEMISNEGNSRTTMEGVVHSAKKRPLCSSMFSTPLGPEGRHNQGHRMATGEGFTPRCEGGGAAPAEVEPFDLQLFHSHQVAKGGALRDSNTGNNRDLFSDSEPQGAVPAEVLPLHTPFSTRGESKWTQWMQEAGGSREAADSPFPFDFHPRKSPLQMVPPHQNHD